MGRLGGSTASISVTERHDTAGAETTESHGPVSARSTKRNWKLVPALSSVPRGEQT